MGICYHCGTDLENPFRCPHCNLTFCEEHAAQRAHNCIALNNQLSGVTSRPPVAKAIHYVEAESEASQERPPKRRIKKKQGILGAGVTRRKVVLVVLIVTISLFSIMTLNQWEPEPDKPGVGAVFPITIETMEQQEYVVQLINKARIKEKLVSLEYNNNSLPQRYAEEMLDTGVFKHNPDLPGTMGENIDLFALGADYNVTEVLELLIHDQIHNDEANGQGNHDNIFYESYVQLSVGVAYNDEVLYLVLNFE